MDYESFPNDTGPHQIKFLSDTMGNNTGKISFGCPVSVYQRLLGTMCKASLLTTFSGDVGVVQRILGLALGADYLPQGMPSCLHLRPSQETGPRRSTITFSLSILSLRKAGLILAVSSL